MDPLSQGALGAALPLATRRRTQAVVAGGLGFIAGMMADLDVLIRSQTDPLLFLEYHRQFTHSLIFIPVGGLIAALLLYRPFRRWHGLTFPRTWMFCALGYGTHGSLDTATSYGTVLLWPFSDARFSWSIISIVDPLFTLPVLALAIAGVVRRNGAWGRAALVWALVYLGLGTVQHRTALAMGHALAADRGHAPLRLEVKPSFANILVWKVIYETADRFHVDAVRAGIGPMVMPGTSVPRLDPARDFPWLRADSRQARDIARFARYSDGYVARDPNHPDRVIDVRYSFVPNEIAPLWSIGLWPDAAPAAHVTFETHRESVRARLPDLWRMIIGMAP
ncbi:MAG: metal-dependent hydrolase [Rhodospirillaceae bacterium]|nr:metal-dependent hydrolase [Magnetovibrio sp.]MAY67175.1 metal-dependent hydrolase [Rhodospirillaceae bacterium]